MEQTSKIINKKAHYFAQNWLTTEMYTRKKIKNKNTVLVIVKALKNYFNWILKLWVYGTNL